MTTKQEVEWEAQRLQHAVSEAVSQPDVTDLAGIAAVLQQAATRVSSLRARTIAHGEITVSPERMRLYFPTPSGEPSADEPREADERWQEALERGRRYRGEALEQVGPLLTPAETARRLGVSPVTVNK